MTIGKKLYLGFGIVLGIMIVLLGVNIFTVKREHDARGAVGATVTDMDAIESVRYQLIQNRLFLGSYLLSGDLRDEARTNKGINDLQDLLNQSEAKVTDTILRADRK